MHMILGVLVVNTRDHYAQIYTSATRDMERYRRAVTRAARSGILTIDMWC